MATSHYEFAGCFVLNFLHALLISLRTAVYQPLEYLFFLASEFPVFNNCIFDSPLFLGLSFVLYPVSAFYRSLQGTSKLRGFTKTGHENWVEPINSWLLLKRQPLPSSTDILGSHGKKLQFCFIKWVNNVSWLGKERRNEKQIRTKPCLPF